jgi:XTP/dITP diphosphohydrolase
MKRWAHFSHSNPKESEAIKQLVLATRNADKTRELLPLLEDLNVELLTLDRFPDIGQLEESAETLEGNALLKAEAVFRATGLPSLSDDTGLEVHYLNGAPGVYSSRFAGPGATYADNVRKLLSAMRGVPPRRRGARFRAVISFCAPGREPVCVEGECKGVILERPSGSGGFGYDPIFQPDGFPKTFAQLLPEEKNASSHRGRALVAMRPILRDYFGKP